MTPSKRCSPNSVRKFNPYHGADGRFTTASGGGGGGVASADNSPRGYKSAIKAYKKGYNSGRFGADKDPDFAKMQDTGNKLFAKWDSMIKQNPAAAKKRMSSDQATLAKEAEKARNQITSAYRRRDYDSTSKWERELKFIKDQQRVLGLISSAAKFDTTQKSIAAEGVAKFNPHHDSKGRFASASSGGAVAGGRKGPKSYTMGSVKTALNQFKEKRIKLELNSWTSKEGKGKDLLKDDMVRAFIKDKVFVHEKGTGDYDVHMSVLTKSAPDIMDIEDVTKFNPYHGADGRFASANSAASFTYAPGKSKAHDLAIAREKERRSTAEGKEKPQMVSTTSTGGKLVDDGSGNFYGENDNGYSASILDCGKSDLNFYRYGSRQVYEVSYNSDSQVGVKPKTIVPTKKEAKQLATAWLKQTKDYDPAYEYDADGTAYIPF